MKTKSPLLPALAVMLALFLGGCAGTPINWAKARQVQVGMTTTQVEEIMGRPYMVSTRGEQEVWVWSFATGFGGAESMTVIIEGDKVVSVPKIPDSFK